MVDLQGNKSYMFYILGAIDSALAKDENTIIPFTDLKEI